MREHPTRLFIKSLIFRKKTANEICSILREYGLPGIPEEFKYDYLDKLTLEFDGKSIETLEPLSKEYKECIKEHKIYYILHPDSVLSSCSRLLDHHSVKHDLYVSLMGRLEDDDIVAHINRLY